MATKTHLNNRYFGVKAGVRVRSARRLKNLRATNLKLNQYTFTLTGLVFEELNRGTIDSDTDPSSFPGPFTALASTSNYTVTIYSDKAKSELSLYDLLEAIEADPNNPVALSGLVWNHVGDDYYLEDLTLNNVTYEDVGQYLGDPPDAWDGTSWMYFTEHEKGPTSDENPEGSPSTMAGFSSDTLSDRRLFSGDDQAFEYLYMSYETMVYTWTQ